MSGSVSAFSNVSRSCAFVVRILSSDASASPGKLGEVDSPKALIEALGNYAVDLVTEDETKSVYFKTREEAIAYLQTLPGGADADPLLPQAAHASLRNTTLEDVFVERIGRRLTVR